MPYFTRTWLPDATWLVKKSGHTLLARVLPLRVYLQSGLSDLTVDCLLPLDALSLDEGAV